MIIAAPTSRPASRPLPKDDDPECDICDGLMIGNPNGIITVNGASVTCNQAQMQEAPD
jgi:hypothetical protein